MEDIFKNKPHTKENKWPINVMKWSSKSQGKCKLKQDDIFNQSIG